MVMRVWASNEHLSKIMPGQSARHMQLKDFMIFACPEGLVGDSIGDSIQSRKTEGEENQLCNIFLVCESCTKSRVM